jgi:flagellar biogenesis protein FliO
MAMQISIEGRNRQGPGGGQEVTRGAAGVWALARVSSMAGLLGRAARWSFERILSAQGRGGKRNQMKLVESLALGNRRQLLLVVCDNQRYLVGAGADSVGSLLAIDAVPVVRDRAARGPELVRRRGREAGVDARSRPAAGPLAGPGLSSWH